MDKDFSLAVVSAFGRTDLWPSSLPAQIFDVTSFLMPTWSREEPFNLFKNPRISDEVWSIFARRLDLELLEEGFCFSLPGALLKGTQIAEIPALKEVFEKGFPETPFAQTSVFELYQKFWPYVWSTLLSSTGAQSISDFKTWENPLMLISPCYKTNPRRSYQQRQQHDFETHFVSQAEDLKIGVGADHLPQLFYQGKPCKGSLLCLLTSFEMAQIFKTSDSLYKRTLKPTWSWKKVSVEGVDNFCPASYFVFIDNLNLSMGWDNAGIFKKLGAGTWDLWIKSPYGQSFEESKKLFKNLIAKVERRWSEKLEINWDLLEQSPFVMYDYETFKNVRKSLDTCIFSLEKVTHMDACSWHQGLRSFLREKKMWKGNSEI